MFGRGEPGGRRRRASRIIAAGSRQGVTMMQFRWRELAASVILGLSLLAMPDTVRAQQIDSMHIAVGSRILVRMRDGTQGQWRLERQSPDGVTLSRRELDGVLIHSVSWATAERIDVQVVDPPSARRMLVGCS